MDKPTAEERAKLVAAFPAFVPVEGDWPKDGLVVPKEQHVAYARFLKEDLGYTLYVTVVGSHWPQKDGPAKLEVATVLRLPANPSRTHGWRVRVADGEPVPTLFPLFAGADWQEREQLDLVGVTFEGHPDPRRLMLPEDWEGYPLRKEYDIATRHAPWR